ncbi:hypothetical protein C518_2911 [Lysinibacillus fusiformis ZB2]|nr:hypothetical protein C518_2911 [Lysinibacillus fusiformis ZB2]
MVETKQRVLAVLKGIKESAPFQAVLNTTKTRDNVFGVTLKTETFLDCSLLRDTEVTNYTLEIFSAFHQDNIIFEARYCNIQDGFVVGNTLDALHDNEVVELAIKAMLNYAGTPINGEYGTLFNADWYLVAAGDSFINTKDLQAGDKLLTAKEFQSMYDAMTLDEQCELDLYLLRFVLAEGVYVWIDGADRFFRVAKGCDRITPRIDNVVEFPS